MPNPNSTFRSFWNTTNDSTSTTNDSTSTANDVFKFYSRSSTTECVESESAGVCVWIWCATATNAAAVRVFECEWGKWFWGSEEWGWVCTDDIEYEWVWSDVEWSIEYNGTDWSFEYADANAECFCGPFEYEWVCSDVEWSIEYADVEWSFGYTDVEWSI